MAQCCRVLKELAAEEDIPVRQFITSILSVQSCGSPLTHAGSYSEGIAEDTGWENPPRNGQWQWKPLPFSSSLTLIPPRPPPPSQLAFLSTEVEGKVDRVHLLHSLLPLVDTLHSITTRTPGTFLKVIVFQNEQNIVLFSPF